MPSCRLSTTRASKVSVERILLFGRSHHDLYDVFLPSSDADTPSSADASKYGPSCTQQQTSSGALNGIPAGLMDNVTALPAFSPAVSDSEDVSVSSLRCLAVADGHKQQCLTINVQGPAAIKSGTLLPVVVWIYGGGFEFGKTSGSDGAPIVARATALGEPVIYVSMNCKSSSRFDSPPSSICSPSSLHRPSQRFRIPCWSRGPGCRCWKPWTRRS